MLCGSLPPEYAHKLPRFQSIRSNSPRGVAVVGMVMPSSDLSHSEVLQEFEGGGELTLKVCPSEVSHGIVLSTEEEGNYIASSMPKTKKSKYKKRLSPHSGDRR
jgi:hypothetical protein